MLGNTAGAFLRQMTPRSCLNCGILHTRHHNALYCVECSLAIKVASRVKPKVLTKTCQNCGSLFEPSSKPAAKYCLECAPSKRKETQRRSVDLNRIRNGVKVGVGSGNNQGSGPEHHSYKSGIGTYQKIGRELLGNSCERCGCKIDKSKSFSWCTHHRDHNRLNNNISNLELLCKKCHQHHHLSKDS